ncbi:ROK family protein [Nonomuraea sp. NPDC050556]|uniref:ROK family transcriptional regulator n=1 Tax=Nonomuraea sp. NPDC050556 TaxID=3364369 RepID=UPI00379B658D
MISGSPADVLTVRRHNLALVLRHVRDRGPRSRTEISAETGLAAGAVTSLAAELIERGLLREAGVRPLESAGRPRRIVEFDGSHLAVIGVQVDVHSITLHATDLGGRPLHEAHVRHGGEVLPVLLAELRDALPAVRNLAGIAVAVPGSVSAHSELVGVAPHLGWREFPLVEALRAEHPAVRFWLDNDANLAAVAEYDAVRGEGLRDVVVLSGSVGVGAGIVIDGRLFRGSDGGAGEAGHVVVAPGGPDCFCGQQGCLEVMAGLPALARLAATDDLLASAEAGDPRTLRALDEGAHWIAQGVGAISALLNPQAVILSGSYAPLAPWLVEQVDRRLAAHRAAAPAYRALRVRAGVLGPDAPARGAAALAVEQLLDDPLELNAEAPPRA